ncbi:MAG: hydrogenase maturation nickel metallochaperone HypA [Desulfovibrionaceae bacterium]|nr:hydrogenase maturation nickel metallochaperone HypA [Desulfovibrionaceae bacterium]
MHEMSLVQQIMNIVVQEKQAHGLVRVTRVVISNGALAGAVTDSLEFAWEALSPGTEVEGVELLVQEVPLKVSCGSCGEVFLPENNFCMPCPKCGLEIGHRVLEGKELRIESIEGDDGSGQGPV